jgi:uncharacterized protein DUF4154
MGIRRALIGLALAAACATQAAEAPARAVQQRIKAAFLYKFAAYVEWPAKAFAQPQSPIVIGVAGDDQVAAELGAVVTGRQVDGRAVEVRRLDDDEPVGDCCQILFVASDSPRAQDLLAAARGRPVLTVTEFDDQQPAGSVINFLAGGDRVRFDISRAAAEHNGLHLRSPLLAVAHLVKNE